MRKTTGMQNPSSPALLGQSQQNSPASQAVPGAGVHVVGPEVAPRAEAVIFRAGVDEAADIRAVIRLALSDDAEHRLELVFLLAFRVDEGRHLLISRVRGEEISSGFGRGQKSLGNNHALFASASKRNLQQAAE